MRPVMTHALALLLTLTGWASMSGCGGGSATPDGDTDRQKKRLSILEHLNLKINRAYLMKEIFMAL